MVSLLSRCPVGGAAKGTKGQLRQRACSCVEFELGAPTPILAVSHFVEGPRIGHPSHEFAYTVVTVPCYSSLGEPLLNWLMISPRAMTSKIACCSSVV